MSRKRYTVTYTLSGHAWTECSDPIATITTTVAEMQTEGIEIDFAGATQEINADGNPIAVTARYTAPNKGTIGRCNWRSRLPASGPPLPARDSDSTHTQNRLANRSLHLISSPK